MEPHQPDDVADAFEAQRGRLVSLAHRMLGSRADAEDAVQEAWLRLSRQDPAGIGNLPGWLTTVVGRVCLDVLRSRKVRPEVSYDDHLPEMIVTADDEGPEDDALLADSLGLALLVVLDTLSPSERMAFVLHDMFAVPFDQIGQILGKSVDASKMLASRARRKVRGTPRTTDERRQQRAVVDAFLAASREGDFERLLEILDPDVMWRAHTGRGVVVRLGATQVAGKAAQAGGAKLVSGRVLVNGEPGIMAWTPQGRPVAVMACTVVNGRITVVESEIDQTRIRSMDLPDPPSGTQ